jgi:hypothetical protein
MVEPKDVVIAILGASAALGGFVLVFLGIVITSKESYGGGTGDEVIRPFRTAGTALLGAFGISLVAVASSLIWLINGGNVTLYDMTIVVFAIQLIAVYGSALWTTRMVLWR